MDENPCETATFRMPGMFIQTDRHGLDKSTDDWERNYGAINLIYEKVDNFLERQPFATEHMDY
jgi:hypothetical protein